MPLTRFSVSLAIVASTIACTDGPTEPRSGPPARLESVSGRTFSGAVGTRIETPLGVRVVDKDGIPVRGVAVRFKIVEGPGTLSAPSAATDGDGHAWIHLSLGPLAGTYRVHASVSGLAGLAFFVGEGFPGPAARVVITPGQLRLAAVGDSGRLRALAYDAFGNGVTTSPVEWRSADPEIVSVDGSGVAVAMRAVATGRIIASSGDRADTAFAVVADPSVSPCLGYGPPVVLRVGESLPVSMADGACIASGGAEDEYVLIPWHGSTVASSTAPLHVTGVGLAPVTASQSVTPTLTGVADLRSGFGAADPPRSFALERTIRDAGRGEIMALARRARDLRRRWPDLAPTAAAIPANLAVGDRVELNASVTASCSSPSLRVGRVAALSARAAVVHDTANPPGGFTTEDYRRFAVTFDTLVAPVSEAAFGAPTDIDRNGRVLIFFTRAVNELTPVGAQFYYGGFFHPRDLLPREQNGTPFCSGSNAGEMVYLLVPDVEGVINGNVRRRGFVDSVTVGTLAHEYQHLINSGRRAYVNDAIVDEELWLNEGLSHIAEELVFYRAAGRAPRQNIGGGSFGQQPFDGLYTQYLAPNFGRLRTFLLTPHISSPYTGEDLAMRGAIWSFLRYAADRRGATDGDVWMRLVNSRTAGLENLRQVFGPDAHAMVHDWGVALFADDYIPGVAAAFTQPSWDFRTAFPVAPGLARSYPLVDAVRRMSDGTSHPVQLRGGSLAFLRFAVAPGREAAIRVTSNGLVPPPTVRATIVRRR